MRRLGQDLSSDEIRRRVSGLGITTPRRPEGLQHEPSSHSEQEQSPGQSKRVTHLNAVVSFLSLERLHALMNDLPLLAANFHTERARLMQSEVRPYPLDCFASGRRG